jgi:hypothetical protein
VTSAWLIVRRNRRAHSHRPCHGLQHAWRCVDSPSTRLPSTPGNTRHGPTVPEWRQVGTVARTVVRASPRLEVSRVEATGDRVEQAEGSSALTPRRARLDALAVGATGSRAERTGRAVDPAGGRAAPPASQARPPAARGRATPSLVSATERTSGSTASPSWPPRSRARRTDAPVGRSATSAGADEARAGRPAMHVARDES